MKKITVEELKALTNDAGITLKSYKPITYKTGYQVADYGHETTDAAAAYEFIKQMNGNAGIWLHNGTYYIDHSFRIKEKDKALETGRQHNQISILEWRTMNLIYC